jgi:hypothetical protein
VKPARWPAAVLVIDCETTIDERQALTFGAYRYCRLNSSGRYHCVEQGLVLPDDAPTADRSIARAYVNTHEPASEQGEWHVRTRQEFFDRVFWRAALDPPHGAGALIVGFHMFFDLVRLAVDCREAKRRDEVWSLVMDQDDDPNTGRRRDNPLRPRIVVTPKDSKAAFYRFSGVGVRSKKSKKRLKPYSRGRFLDLRTLGWALRNRSFTLESACEAFGVPGKLDHQPTGRVSIEEIDYCREDVRATLDVLNAMRAEFDQHPLSLPPERAYSPASIAKAYYDAMGILPPAQKFGLPSELQGYAMAAYFGGRAEVRVRHESVPVVLVDFLSEYASVNTLLGLWQFVIAERLRVEDATDAVRHMLASLTPDDVFTPAFWKTLTVFALVEPDGDVLPVRTHYNGTTTNIGVNPLTSQEPVWVAGPDLVAAFLLTGRAPKVRRAIRLVPEGQQAGLTRVSLRGLVDIDPPRDDFFRRVVEARVAIEQDCTLTPSEREGICYFLKILASAGSYGLFVEVNPEQVAPGARAPVRVFSGEAAFDTTSTIVEWLGRWYGPVLASLIAAGGRLLLARLERSVTEAGGTYLFCDTDSLAIVASKHGGPVPCAGPDGTQAMTAVPWSVVDQIVARFKDLNPYDRTIVAGSILRVERLNYVEGHQREVRGVAISAKRYVLIVPTLDGGFQIVKLSAHGLGYLYRPIDDYDKTLEVPVWVRQAWEWLVARWLGRPIDPPDWFGLPAMMQFAITTPKVLAALQARQAGWPYRDRVKPSNFVLSPILNPLGGHPTHADPQRFALMAPFTSDASRWCGLTYINMHDGSECRLGAPGQRLACEAEALTYGEIVARYWWHPEAKSLGPDGQPCHPRTRGLLQRLPVTASTFHWIGKETDRRWDQEDDLSLIDPMLVEYRPNETDQIVTDADLAQQLRQFSIRQFARASGHSPTTIKAARRGERLRRETIEALRDALDKLNELRSE